MAVYEYDFSAFESSAARKLNIKEEKANRPHLVKIEAEPEMKSPQQIRFERRKARLRCARIIVATVIALSLFMVYLYGYSRCDSIDRQISSITTDYNMVCGENTELAMKLSNMVSLEQIEKVAVEELGLVKLSSADIEFVRLDGESKVLVTQGKTAE